MRYDSLLRGSTAIVTGASRGIGAAAAEAIASAGADVGMVARSAGELEAGADRLRAAYGVKVAVAVADAAEPSQMAVAVSDLSEELGPANVLVNAAGIIVRSEAAEMPAEDWSQVLTVNLTAAFEAARAVYPQMLRRGGGSIINITSLSAHFGIRRAAAYGASKGGLRQLTAALALEWGQKGIRVNGVSPGYVETDLTAGLRADPDRTEQIRSRIPLGRWAKPADISGTVVFLASPLAEYVTGQILVVDGGYSIDG